MVVIPGERGERAAPAGRSSRGVPERLPDGARVLVVGGGPAGSFFALVLLREARRAGRSLRVTILERRMGLVVPGDLPPARLSLSCNYCAGGISPRLSDELDRMGLSVPPPVVQSNVDRIVVQSHWKNLELKVPPGRRLITVYRGSRPTDREERHQNFDSFLLSAAAREGAQAICATVTGLGRSPSGRPTVEIRHPGGDEERLEGDFLVYAGGVNPSPGLPSDRFPLGRDLRRVLPGFAPPRLRRTLIFELELSPELAASMEGELVFFLYGSRDLRLEMGSLMPKGRFATAVLIGPDVDHAAGVAGPREIIEKFLSLPHVRRVLPSAHMRPTASCLCRPNMVVGCATNPCGDRVAVIGDALTSKLYKDGLYSAFMTGGALARAVLSAGVDGENIGRMFWPLIRSLNADQRSGRAVFLSMSMSFSNPIFSRMAYQAVLRERRLSPEGERPLESILWSVASGDDGYGNVLRAMLDPRAIYGFVVRGALVTLRNRMTETLFGLSWRGLSRHPTGLYREEVSAKIEDLSERGVNVRRFSDFRRMYTIRIRAPARAIYDALGRIGDPDRRFLRQRFVDVRRVSGDRNRRGGVIRYEVALRPLSFDLALEVARAGRTLAYRVRNGFARGGLLVFDIEERRPSDCALTLLVAFDFRSGAGGVRSLIWALYRALFPKFVHDVLWNHALCKLKDVVEEDGAQAASLPDLPAGPAKKGKTLSN